MTKAIFVLALAFSAAAAGIVGAEAAIKAAPDGYTLLFSSSGPLAVNPGLYSKLPYDSLKDLQPVYLAATVPDEFAAYIRSELSKWSKVIRDSGAKVE